MEIDRDVFCEQQLVKSLQSVSDGIVIDSLRKEYPGGFGCVCGEMSSLTTICREGPKVAVDNLSLRIPRGECFGLLGPNGAGFPSCLRPNSLTYSFHLIRSCMLFVIFASLDLR